MPAAQGSELRVSKQGLRLKMSKSKDLAPVEINGGRPCPKCELPMKRFQHSAAWRPLPGRGFYKYWDRCVRCGHFQNYPEAHVPK